jgi:transcriptional regulator with XRE-family HTH domain
MAKSFKDLRSKMSLRAQKASRLKAQAMLETMPLSELRLVRKLSQEQMASILNVKQAAVSKLERRTDMYISTLRSFIEAMGGHLEITAEFPDGTVKINQFEELDRNSSQAS